MKRFNVRRFNPLQLKQQESQQSPSLQLPLRLILTLPFVLLTVGTTGLVGYLSWQNGQASVHTLANRLTQEVSHRVAEKLDAYRATPHLINASNLDAVELGEIDLQNFDQLGQHFFRQLDLYPDITSIVYANEQGEIIGYRHDAGQKEMTIATTAEPGVRYHYRLDERGNRTKLTRILSNYDPRVRPWYEAAKQTGTSAWSPIYPWSIAPEVAITAVLPTYKTDGALEGVFAVDILLQDINRYLRSILSADSGQIFVIETSGNLVATSTAETPFVDPGDGQSSQRLRVPESQDPTTRAVARQLIEQFGSFEQIKSIQQLRLSIPTVGPVYAQVRPSQDSKGLNWLIVTVLPESEFMAEIYANTRTTLLLCLGTLGTTILLGLWLSQVIARPIQRLGQAGLALADGQWEQPIRQESLITELQVLNTSFERMAAQLQQSFDRARTALQESEEKFAKVFRTCPDAIGIVTLAGCYLEVNDAFVNLFGYSRAEVLGRKATEIGHWLDLEERQRYVQLVQSGEQVRNLEFTFRTKAGERLTVLFSADSIELQGQPYLIGIAKDITSRKQAEEALRQSEARLQSLASAAPVNIYSFVQHSDGLSEFEYLNRVVEEFHEVSLEEFVSNPVALIMEQMHPDDRQGYIDRVAHSAETLEQFQYEWRIIPPSGKLKWLQARSQPERRPNGDICWHGVVLDISDRKFAEDALRHSEAALRRAQQVAHIGSWEVDVHTERVLWSEESFHIFGWDMAQPEPSMAQFYELVHPDDRLVVKNAVAHMIHDGSSYKIEFRIIHPDGSLRYVEARGEAVRNEQGQVVQLLGTNLDITERQQAEEALRISEATKNQILKAIPDLIIWMTADGTCIDFLDGSGVTNLYQKSEVIGVNLYGMLPPELAEARMRAIQQALNTGEVQIYEQHFLLKDNVQHEEVRVISVGDDRILVIVRDITDRKQAEAALLDSEARFRSAFWDAPIGMALIGLDDCWLKVNPMLCEMLGASEAELLSVAVSSRVHPEDMDKLHHCYEQVQLDETRNAQVELRYCCHAGQLTWGLLSLSLVRDAQNQPFYYVAQIQDITEQHAVDQMKNEFISIVSHELRTPLTAIRGFLGLLDTGIYDNKPDKAKHMLRQALTNSDRLVRLVNDILDLERLSSGRVELVMEVCEAQELMQRAVAGLQSLADSASITLTVLPTSVQVWAAPDSIIQTLTNLVGNAIKFSPAHAVVILQAQPQPDFALFQIKDQGRGIPADKLETIFGRFQQVDVSDARQKGGTGLGLAICQSIVEQHGGNIWAESSLGEGSTFYFTLPLSNQSENDKH
ncbi:MAG: PAS domain S-box protein [Cyanobacteria bacterium RM1_2_2]|nr:PAS domain S-box protein [Cyanobacteria bacterium RM1_2_2]